VNGCVLLMMLIIISRMDRLIRSIKKKHCQMTFAIEPSATIDSLVGASDDATVLLKQK
jgi:hypothetical protein